MERRALITVLERSNRRLVEDHQRFVYAALERPEQHVGEHAAAALAQTSEQDVHPLLVGHLIRSACSFRIPDSASGSAGTYLALTLATCPYKRVDQSPVLLPVVARHVKQDAARAWRMIEPDRTNLGYLETWCRIGVRPDSVQVPGETLPHFGCPPVSLVWLSRGLRSCRAPREEWLERGLSRSKWRCPPC